MMSPTEYETDCAVEQASAFARGINAELQTGEIVAWIDPTSDIWTDKGLAMSGMTADYKGTQYRVAGELPAGRLRSDPQLAAELEVAWWHADRSHQHDAQVTYDDIVTAMVRFYCYLYQAEPADVRRAAELRVQAMALSDAWVAAGCHLDDPRLAGERLALVASYVALRDANHRSELSTDLARGGYATAAACVTLVSARPRRLACRRQRHRRVRFMSSG